MNASPFSPEPKVNQEIILVVLGTVALSIVLALMLNYAP